MKINLSSSQWQVRGYWPHTPLFGRSMETQVEMGAVTHWIPATVPGCVVSDLLKNDFIEDPYYEMNSLKCEWVANRWWVYKTEFILDETYRGKDIALVFLGVDYKCNIIFNNETLIEHEGMYEPIRLDISSKACIGTNTLEVVLESPPNEMGQVGYTSKVHTQKSRFDYKWDFATRLVHTGIWDDVYLDVTPGARISNIHVSTSLDGECGIVDIGAQLKLTVGNSYRLTATLQLNGETVTEKSIETLPGLAEQEINLSLMADHPQLWWPNGYGGQSLYDLSIHLYCGEDLCDSFDVRVGIRSLEYEYNDGVIDALPYVVKINGKPIYLNGINITPLDHMIGSVTKDRYTQMLSLAKDANVNLIRVWGGGIVEKDFFYNLCDEYGIMVWQEFNQSSSGIDNVPPKDKDFLRLLYKNATAYILGRRNHVCLTYWSGGNELMDFDGVPVAYDDTNIAMLKELVESLDPDRLFLPTSASGPTEFLDVSEEGLGKNHDVHGPWQYQGSTRHYEIYNKSDSLLHSEFGVDGFTNHNAALRFLSEANRIPSNVKDNLVWRHHGEWWDTTKRDCEQFGELKSLKKMIACSQYIQAEGLRYAVESNRRRAFQNCGSIIWQFNEPWPNLFCTSLVDYYCNPKAAYWWVKRAYMQQAVSLRYDRLIYEQGSVFKASVWVVDNESDFNGSVVYRVLDLLGLIHHQGSFHANSCGRHSVMAGNIEFIADSFPYGFFIVELTIGEKDAGLTNQYLFSYNREPAFASLFTDCECSNVRIFKADCGHEVFLENEGNIAALFVRLSLRNGTRIFQDNGFILYPGQTRQVDCDVLPDNSSINVDWLNSKK